LSNLTKSKYFPNQPLETDFDALLLLLLIVNNFQVFLVQINAGYMAHVNQLFLLCSQSQHATTRKTKIMLRNISKQQQQQQQKFTKQNTMMHFSQSVSLFCRNLELCESSFGFKTEEIFLLCSLHSILNKLGHRSPTHALHEEKKKREKDWLFDGNKS
jgi:hypothetical protein